VRRIASRFREAAAGPGCVRPHSRPFSRRDAIFVLDVPPEVGHARRGSRTEDRIEARGGDYHRRVREGFLRAAALEVRAHVVDASRSLEAVQEDLRARVGGLLS
jgi:dTMP kinase